MSEDDARELAHLRARLALTGALDDLLEEAAVQRTSLADLLGRALPRVQAALGARAVWLESLDEDLTPRTWSSGPVEDAWRARAAGRLGDAAAAREPLPDGLLLAHRLDVAGEHFGAIAALVPGPLEARAADDLAALLHAAAEQLDNHLASVRQARLKQGLLRAIHDALRHPLVHEGVRLAIERMAEHLRFDLLIVLYHLQEDYQGTIHYLVFRGDRLALRTGDELDHTLDRVLRAAKRTAPGGAPLLVSGAELAHRVARGEQVPDLRLEGESDRLLEALGYRDCVENVLIAGLDDAAVVGKLVVASRHPLGTFERDVVQLFADVLQKRIVDYDEAGQLLHRTFAIPTVLRLLEEERPLARLSPRSAEVSILYADVAGFTALSERVLVEPAVVSAFVEAWSRGVTRVLWEVDGVFDKLVGDCIIGLFGPPFYDLAPAERALRCARAAAEMVRFTRAMRDAHPAAARIREAGAPLGVAIGINDCPASVGLFGPNQDFTAFSSGMNQTARLQGVATRDEVLVMEPMVRLLEAAGAGLRFGPRREAAAKNVAEPLVFRALDLESIPAAPAAP